jgi:AcrR family transcriptional regulator
MLSECLASPRESDKLAVPADRTSFAHFATSISARDSLAAMARSAARDEDVGGPTDPGDDGPKGDGATRDGSVDGGAAGDSNGEAVWRTRAIERSTRAARQRAATRVHQFLNSAREIIAENGSIDFTVQEVVDRSRQSLRSFYQYFDGKHELLLALFEEEMSEAVGRIKAATVDGDPLDRLERSTRILFDMCSPNVLSEQPLFAEFAQRLLLTHPEEVARAYSPLFDYVASIVEEAAELDLLRPGRPRRQTAIILQSATTTAGRGGGVKQPITSAEMWEFVLHAICPDDVVAARAA